MIDGTALHVYIVIERALEILIPIMGHRMKFLKILEEPRTKNTNMVVGESIIEKHVHRGG